MIYLNVFEEETVFFVHGTKKLPLCYTFLSDTVECDIQTKYSTYGISISILDETGINVKEQAVIRDISTVKNKVYAFLLKLIENTVTPVSLHDVVEDFLS